MIRNSVVLFFLCVGVNVCDWIFDIVSRLGAAMKVFVAYVIGNCWARVLVIREVDNYGLNIIALKAFAKMLKRGFWLHWNFWMSLLKPRYASVVKDKNLIIIIIWGSQILSNDFKVLF